MSTGYDVDRMERTTARKRAYGALTPTERSMFDAVEKRVAHALHRETRSAMTFEMVCSLAEYLANRPDLLERARR